MGTDDKLLYITGYQIIRQERDENKKAKLLTDPGFETFYEHKSHLEETLHCTIHDLRIIPTHVTFGVLPGSKVVFDVYKATLTWFFP